MKVIISLLTLSLHFANFSTAQLNVGKELLGFSFSFSSSSKLPGGNNSNASTTSVGINPYISKIVRQKAIQKYDTSFGIHSIGPVFAHSFSRTKSPNNVIEQTKKSNSIGLIYAFEHLAPIGRTVLLNFHPRAGFLYSYGNQIGTQNLIINKHKTYIGNVGLSSGVTFIIKDKIRDKWLFDILLNNLLSVHYRRAMTKDLSPMPLQSKETIVTVQLASTNNILDNISFSLRRFL